MTFLHNYYIQSRIFFHKNDFESALNYINQAIDQDPCVVYFYHIRYAICKEWNKINKSADSYVKKYDDLSNFTELTDFLELADDDNEVDKGKVYLHYTRAEVFFEQEKFKAALQNINSAIDLNPQIRDFYKMRCNILKKLNEISPDIFYNDKIKEDLLVYHQLENELTLKHEFDLNYLNAHHDAFVSEFEHLHCEDYQNIMVKCGEKFVEWFHRNNDAVANFWLQKAQNYSCLPLENTYSLILIKTYQRDFYERQQHFLQAFECHREIEILSHNYNADQDFEHLINVLCDVIKSKESFTNYESVFTNGRLNDVNLKYHLRLLLIAISVDNEDWIKQLFDYNKLLSNYNPLNNIVSTFVHQLTDEECDLFSAEQLDRLLIKIEQYQPQLAKKLHEIDQSLSIKLTNRLDHQRVWNDFRFRNLNNNLSLSRSTFFKFQKSNVNNFRQQETKSICLNYSQQGNYEQTIEALHLAIKKKQSFIDYKNIFTEGKLDHVDLEYHLHLLLVALSVNNEDWVKQLLNFDKPLGNYDPSNNIVGVFIHQLKIKKERSTLFSAEQLHKLLTKVKQYQPQLFEMLIRFNESLFFKLSVRSHHRQVWNAFQPISNTVFDTLLNLPTLNSF